ncbi:MAG: hypothetical protein JJU31_01445 [Wenzhouxiangella sp.]|nr:hypothetical protein [Wenzhouxiangella sp.]
MRLFLIVLVLTASLVPAARSAWEIEEQLLDRGAGLSVAAIDAWQLKFEGDVLDGDPAVLPLRLPGRAVKLAEREQLLYRSANDQTWVGRVAEDGTRLVLTVRQGWMAGKIFAPGQSWEIRPTADFGTVLMLLDDARFPECSGAEAPDSDFRRSQSRPQPANRKALVGAAPLVYGPDTVRIDTLVAYTPAARAHLGGTGQAEAFLQLGVDLTNLSFINSDVDVVFRAVHFAELASQESSVCTGTSGDLLAARNNANLRNLRTQYQADLVAMITMGSYCGCAYVQRTPGPGFHDFAYQATSVSCAVGNLTLAHEYGHNLGMEHDPANGTAPENASFPYAFGHFVSGRFRTVMSYSNQCSGGCPRQTHFSNPDVSFSGQATGIAGQRNNAEVARRVSPIVRDFELPDDEPMPEPLIEPARVDILTGPGETGYLQFSLINAGNGSFSFQFENGNGGPANHSPEQAAISFSSIPADVTSSSPSELRQQTGCDAVSEIPWLVSLNPLSGSLAASGSQLLSLAFDATGLAAGSVHEATLCLRINDPRIALIEIPVLLDTSAPDPLFTDDFRE